MEIEGQEMKIRRIEKSHLQKFKNQVKISKEFGKRALKVYNVIGKSDWTDLEEVVELSGMDKDSVLKIIEFMEKNGMLEIEGEVKEQKAPQEITSEETAKEEREEASVEEAPVEEVEIEEIQPEGVGEIKPEMEEIEIEEKPQEELITPERVEEKVEETKTPQEGEETFTSYTEEESIVYSKYGEVGVRIYNAMKEGRSIRNIAIEEGLSESEVKEIANFLEEKGLFHPKEEIVEEEEEEKFAPLSSDIEETLKAAEVSDEDAILEHRMESAPFLKSMSAKFSIALKHKRQGREVFDFLADHQPHDTLEIVKALRIPMDKVEEVLKDLKSQGLVKSRKLNRQDIRKKYGYDSLAVYRKYGKRGVLMYDLVGKDLSLKEIARLASIKDKEMIYEIFSFIHRLLGIEVPIDKSLIMKQLE